jgi:arylsulfatase A-like enzyme
LVTVPHLRRIPFMLRCHLPAWSLAACSALVLAAVNAPGAPAADRPPNIIFILADDLGYGDLGCYGQVRIRTPHLNQMAREGLRFTQCYAGSTVCAPSRCALMTGLHAGHGRIRGNSTVPLRPEDVTVAEILQKAGYTTGLVGKWGLGEPGTTGVPNRKGFDYFFGFLNQVDAHNYYPDYLWRNTATVAIAGNVVKNRIAVRRAQYAPDLFTSDAIAFMEKNRDRPFFLYLAYTTPHANNELARVTGNGMETPTDEPYKAKSWPQVEKNKAAMITGLDADIGRLLQRLKALGLEESTVVFFSSDNGPHKEGGVDPQFFDSAGPFRGHKRDLTEGGIREPLIVRWPGKIVPNRASDVVTAFWDFPATAAELAGAPAPAGDGISMVPTLFSQAGQKTHDFLYWEFGERGFQQAVRMGDWKATRPQADEPLELYDLKTDPGEAHNVADSHSDVVSRIEAYLKTARTPSADFPIKPRPKSLPRK